MTSHYDMNLPLNLSTNSKTNDMAQTNPKVGEVVLEARIPFSTTNPVALIASPANASEILLILFDSQSKQLKFVKYSITLSKFEEIFHPKEYSKRRTTTIIGIFFNPIQYQLYVSENHYWGHSLSYQMIDISHLENKDNCILIIINSCVDKHSNIQSAFNYHCNKDRTYSKKWCGIFDCKSLKMQQYCVNSTSDIRSNHYCIVYKQWLFMAYADVTEYLSLKWCPQSSKLGMERNRPIFYTIFEK